jgi:hypothetical protein
LIERKAAGEQIAVQPAPEESSAPVPDLMSALKASLDAVKARDADANGATKKRRAGKPKAPPTAAKAKPKPSRGPEQSLNDVESATPPPGRAPRPPRRGSHRWSGSDRGW